MKKLQAVEYEYKAIKWATFPDICKSCGLCIEKCPVKCLHYDETKMNYLGLPAVKCEVEKCIACQTCVTSCPDCAIVVEGKK